MLFILKTDNLTDFLTINMNNICIYIIFYFTLLHAVSIG